MLIYDCYHPEGTHGSHVKMLSLIDKNWRIWISAPIRDRWVWTRAQAAEGRRFGPASQQHLQSGKQADRGSSALLSPSCLDELCDGGENPQTLLWCLGISPSYCGSSVYFMVFYQWCYSEFCHYWLQFMINTSTLGRFKQKLHKLV